jgi:hypothetical protein
VNVTEWGEVHINFSEPILMPPGTPDFKPDNKISADLYFQDVKDYDGLYRFEMLEND